MFKSEFERGNGFKVCPFKACIAGDVASGTVNNVSAASRVVTAFCGIAIRGSSGHPGLPAIISKPCTPPIHRHQHAPTTTNGQKSGKLVRRYPGYVSLPRGVAAGLVVLPPYPMVVGRQAHPALYKEIHVRPT